MPRKYEVLETGKKPHVHYRPGPFRRWLKGMRLGSVIRCRCGTYFKLAEPNYTYKPTWTRINDWELEKHGIKKETDGQQNTV